MSNLLYREQQTVHQRNNTRSIRETTHGPSEKQQTVASLISKHPGGGGGYIGYTFPVHPGRGLTNDLCTHIVRLYLATLPPQIVRRPNDNTIHDNMRDYDALSSSCTCCSPTNLTDSAAPLHATASTTASRADRYRVAKTMIFLHPAARACSPNNLTDTVAPLDATATASLAQTDAVPPRL